MVTPQLHTHKSQRAPRAAGSEKLQSTQATALKLHSSCAKLGSLPSPRRLIVGLPIGGDEPEVPPNAALRPGTVRLLRHGHMYWNVT